MAEDGASRLPIAVKGFASPPSTETIRSRVAIMGDDHDVADETSSLDDHRGMAAQRATEARRRKSAVIKDQSALRARREELEKFLFAAPAENWPDAVAKARYLLTLFAESTAADDERYGKLIKALLVDFDHLLD